MTNNEEFVEGVNIIAKYMVDKPNWSVQASHDKIYWGGYDWVTDEEDIKRLEKLGWNEDEDSWCFYT